MIRELKTPYDLRPFFEQFPEDRWLTEVLHNGSDRCCAMGFVVLSSDLAGTSKGLIAAFEVHQRFELLFKNFEHHKSLTIAKGASVRALSYPLNDYWNRFVAMNNG